MRQGQTCRNRSGWTREGMSERNGAGASELVRAEVPRDVMSWPLAGIAVQWQDASTTLRPTTTAIPL
jgi:hypothetical protein